MLFGHLHQLPTLLGQAPLCVLFVMFEHHAVSGHFLDEAAMLAVGRVGHSRRWLEEFRVGHTVVG